MPESGLFSDSLLAWERSMPQSVPPHIVVNLQHIFHALSVVFRQQNFICCVFAENLLHFLFSLPIMSHVLKTHDVHVADV